MSIAKKVLVTGATGSQGGAVIRSLLARGYDIRALTRNSKSPSAQHLSEQGVELVEGDFTKQDTLKRAAEGVGAVFGMTTPYEAGVEIETEQGIAFIEAVKAAGNPHFVFSSVASADQATGIPHFDSKFKVEEVLKSSGLPYTIVAPVFFMDNLLSPWILPGLKEGNFSLGMTAECELQQVAVENIGQFAASIIERGEAVYGKRYDIAGDSLSGARAAAILSKASGREIAYQGYSPDVIRAENEDWAIMFDWFESTGYSADIAALKKEFPEVGWKNFESWAVKQNWSVLGWQKVGAGAEAGAGAGA